MTESFLLDTHIALCPDSRDERLRPRPERRFRNLDLSRNRLRRSEDRTMVPTIRLAN